MASSWGEHLRVTIFGESHGPQIGVVLDGLPPGEAVDVEEIRSFLGRARRVELRGPQPGGRTMPLPSYPAFTGAKPQVLPSAPCCRTRTPARKITPSSGGCPGRAMPITQVGSATGEPTTPGAGDIFPAGSPPRFAWRAPSACRFCGGGG